MKEYTRLQQRLDEALFRMEKETTAPALYGLFAGKTGAAFCYFQLAGLYRREENTTTGYRLTEEVLAALPSVKDITFGTGLAGIGWGLETMYRNGYATPDTSTTLDYIDDEIYKYATFRKTADLTLDNGLLGSLIYLASRLDTVAGSPFRYRSLLLQECITLLISDLGTAVFTADTLTKARCLVFFQQLRGKNWYPDHSKKLLKALKAHIEQQYAAHPDTLTHHELYLLETYAWLAGETDTASMQQQVEEWKKRFRKKLQADEKGNVPAQILPPWLSFSRRMPVGKDEVCLTDCYLLIQNPLQK